HRVRPAAVQHQDQRGAIAARPAQCVLPDPVREEVLGDGFVKAHVQISIRQNTDTGVEVCPVRERFPADAPPSTFSTAPLIQAESLPARKSMTPAMSSGSPSRPSGSVARTASR